MLYRYRTTKHNVANVLYGCFEERDRLLAALKREKEELEVAAAESLLHLSCESLSQSSSKSLSQPSSESLSQPSSESLSRSSSESMPQSMLEVLSHSSSMSVHLSDIDKMAYGPADALNEESGHACPARRKPIESVGLKLVVYVLVFIKLSRTNVLRLNCQSYKILMHC